MNNSPTKAPAERDKPLGYYSWDVNDYRASRRMNGLDHIGRGIMRELFDEIWVEGYIPDDIEEIAAIARVPLSVAGEYWPRLRGLFIPIAGVDEGHLLTHRRVELERTEADRRRVARARAGRKGGLAKAGKNDDPAQGFLALPSNAKQPRALARKEGRKEEEEGSSALGASLALAVLAPSRCPFCGVDDGAHDPDCTPRRLSAREIAP